MTVYEDNVRLFRHFFDCMEGIVGILLTVAVYAFQTSSCLSCWGILMICVQFNPVKNTEKGKSSIDQLQKCHFGAQYN